MPRLFGGVLIRGEDANGDPVSGAKLTVYLAGTTTSVTTYQDSSLSTAHASPVVADSSGVFAAIYLEPGAYKVDITDSEGTSLGGFPVDNVLVSPDALVAFFDTYSDAETASVSADTKTLKLNGYTSAGDGGGAAYTRVDSEPSHAAKLRTSDRAISDGTTDATNGGWWEIVPDPGGIRPQQLGAAGDGATDDTSAVAAALGASDVVFIDRFYALASSLAIDGKKTIVGVGQRQCGFNLIASGARLTIGGSSASAPVHVRDLTVDGGVTATKCIVFADNSNRKNNSILQRLHVTGWTTYGLDIGQNSDQLQIIDCDFVVARSGSTSSSSRAIYAYPSSPAAPFYMRGGSFSGLNGLCVDTQENAVFSGVRFNFARDGLIRVAGRDDTIHVVCDGCYFENCGDNGSDTPTVSSTRKAVECTGGKLTITSPKKIQSGYAGVMFSATGGGIISLHHMPQLVGNVIEATYNVTLFEVGAALDDNSFIEISGQVKLSDASRWTQLSNTWPQTSGYPIRPVSPRAPALVFDGSATTGWSPTSVSGGTISTTTTDGEWLTGTSALTFTNTSTGSRIDYAISGETTLGTPASGTKISRPALWEGEVVSLNVTMKAKETASGDTNLDMDTVFTGSGISLQGQSQTVGADGAGSGGSGDGYDRWWFMSVLAYFDDGAPDAGIRVHGNNDGTNASDDEIFVDAVAIGPFG